MEKSNKNNVWFVTGASKGIGLVLAKKLLKSGARVAATSRRPEELQREIGEKSGTFLPLAMELVDEKSVADAVAATIGHFGSLDVIVNNAGYGQCGTVEEITDNEARRSFDVNVFGMLNVLRAGLPPLRAQRKGHVFNLGSIAGYVGGFSGWGIYCATKFAVSGLTESLAADLKPFGIHTTLVYPGYFRTNFLAHDSMARPSGPINEYESARESEKLHIEDIHHNQPGDPERLADVLIRTQQMAKPPLHLFLGSDSAAMAEAKLADVQQALGDCREISRSTDFPKD